MKKLYMSLAIMALTMLTAISAQAQVSWGLRAGANIVNMKMSSDILGSKNNAGFFVGPTVKFTVPIVGLSFDASALYDQRTAKVVDDANSITEERKQQTKFGFNVSKHYSDWTWKSSQFSVNVGIGATVLSHLELKANYNFVVGKSAVAVDGWAGNSRYNAWQVGLGYYF